MALGSWTIDESSCEVFKSKFNGVTMTWLTLTEIASIWLCMVFCTKKRDENGPSFIC